MASAEIAQRLFVAAPLAAGATVAVTDDQAHYLLHVLRLKADTAVAVFNGRDGEWRAAVRPSGKKKCNLEIALQLRPQAAEPDVWLAFAPLKKARIDLVAEKATELGVAVLQPVITRHTNAERVNVERLGAIAIEAAEQCERLSVPAIRPVAALDDLMVAWPKNRRLFVLDERGGGVPIAAAVQKHIGEPCGFLAGPEGGFSIDEIESLRRHPAVTTIGLGRRILRAETACIAALSCWQAFAGDWR